MPSDIEIKKNRNAFESLAKTASQHGAQVFLMIGPNKSSIYPEYLPHELVPSSKRYSSFFLDNLTDIPNLTIYNPINDFLRLKQTEGLLYWKTDTHWNHKGAFLAYKGLAEVAGLPIPEVEFQHRSTYSGDLIDIAELQNFPLHEEDNWDVIWKTRPIWTENEIPHDKKTLQELASIATNPEPLSPKHVWVVGDSFTGSIKPYLNATFSEVHYIQRRNNTLKQLPEELAHADKKPDMIIIIRVERSF